MISMNVKVLLSLGLAAGCTVVDAKAQEDLVPDQFQTASSAKTYTTSTGAVFTQVNSPSFGLCWADPEKTLWSSGQGDYPWSVADLEPQSDVAAISATDACVAVGGILPSEPDYITLISHFKQDANHVLTAQGQKDLYTLFPDMAGHSFWTSSRPINGSGYANDFNGNSGSFGVDYLGTPLSVRCIIKSATPPSPK
jgi:hypothetical protein